MIIKKIKTWWQSIRYYVIADPNDNSITLSKALFKHIKNNALGSDAAQVFVFKIENNDLFGFIVNPDIKTPTQMCDIQYNDKYRCIGFETLCPSVGKILYDYNLGAMQRVKLSISIHRTIEQNKIYYQFDKPNEKHINKYPKT